MAAVGAVPPARAVTIVDAMVAVVASGAVVPVGAVVAVDAVGAVGAVAAVGAVENPPPSRESPVLPHAERSVASNSAAGTRLPFIGSPARRLWSKYRCKRFACDRTKIADTRTWNCGRRTEDYPRKGQILPLASGRLISLGGRRGWSDASASGQLARLVRITSAASLAGAGVAVINEQSMVRGLEARTGADLARAVGLVPARAIGSAVVFPLHGRFVGYTVTEGCTVAFLVAPFFVIAALLIASRRTPPRRGLGALAVLTVVFFIVNQARLFVVAASMHLWGFRPGYERSHVFVGTTLSTIGAVVGLLLFVRLLASGGSPTDEPTDRLVDAG